MIFADSCVAEEVKAMDGQELYRLYFIEGYSQDEIGEMKGVSQNTISKLKKRSVSEKNSCSPSMIGY